MLTVNRLTNYQAVAGFSASRWNVTQMCFGSRKSSSSVLESVLRVRVRVRVLHGVLSMQMPELRLHLLCLRLFNSHTCSISQCNHKFWLNYRIKMFVLNLKMCVRVQRSRCLAELHIKQHCQPQSQPLPCPLGLQLPSL